MKLAELYIRALRPDHAEFEALAVNLEQHVIDLAKEIYATGVTVEFVLEEGSLIERVKVIGKGLLVAGGVVASYHGLRESVIDIYHDAQKFGEVATKQFLEITHTPKSAVQYKRAIPIDVDRLYRVIQNTDLLQTANLSPADRTFRSEQVISDVARLSLSARQDEGTQKLLKTLPWKKAPGLPDTVAEAAQLVDRRKKITRDGPIFDKPAKLPAKRRRKYKNTTQL